MRRLIGLGLVGLILLILIVAQLVLPGIATQQLRDRLSHSGKVISVSVSAFPAIELLWHQAGSVNIHLASYHTTSGGVGSQLSQTADVGSLNATVGVFQAGLLTLRNATLRKRADELVGSAQVTESDLRAAVPVLQSVTPVASGNGELVLRGRFSAFGLSAAVDATVSASGGALVVAPDLPVAPTIRVFSNSHVKVESVSAASNSTGFQVSATGRLH
jgi:hypothetical protein